MLGSGAVLAAAQARVNCHPSAGVVTDPADLTTQPRTDEAVPDTCQTCPHPPHERGCPNLVTVIDFDVPCPCAGGPHLPAPGQRPIFGVHRLPSGQRYTAAWPTASQQEAAKASARKREIDRVLGRVDSERPAPVGGTDAREVDP